MKTRYLKYLPLLVATMPLAATAAPPAGRLLAAQCAQCHGTNGNGPGFDELAGKSAGELYNELREMKTATKIESIMDRQARHLLGRAIDPVVKRQAAFNPRQQQ